MILPARFWANVNKTGTCWLWTAGVTSRGYGKCYIDGRQTSAHRAVYAALVGPIPDGAMIDHKCHIKTCCNPAHLQIADGVANAQNRKGAAANSRSGVRGVHWHAGTGKWRVQAKVNGRIHSGGLFATLEEAEYAAIRLRLQLMQNSLSDRGQ